MAIPPGFVDLNVAYNMADHKLCNVIGTIVDYMQPKITSGQRYMLTFKITDRALIAGYHGNPSLTVRFFVTGDKDLPNIRGINDIILLRDVKMQRFNQQPMLISSFNTSHLVFPAATISKPKPEIGLQDMNHLECTGVPREANKLSAEEQAYILSLQKDNQSLMQHLPDMYRRALDQHGGATAASVPQLPQKRLGDTVDSDPKRSKTSGSGLKLRRMEELQDQIFADIYAQVVKLWHNHRGYEMYITDYTENANLFLHPPPEKATAAEGVDGDEYSYAQASKHTWLGPFGRRVLKVFVNEPHHQYVEREVKVKDFVFLRNVKVKRMSEGEVLQGYLWRDDLNPDRVNIHKLTHHDHPEIDIIRQREDEYLSSLLHGSEGQPRGAKETWTTRKKKRKERRQQRAAQTGETNAVTKPAHTNCSETNNLVRCGYLNIPVTSLAEIKDLKNRFHTTTTPSSTTYTLPFVNAKHRARVRCIDFMPDDLADFAVVAERPTQNGSLDDENDYMETAQEYEWAFSLLLADAASTTSIAAVSSPQDTLWVSVSHAEAQHLFGNSIPDPHDLRQDSVLLNKLREKLCILWGDLEEVKRKGRQATVSNLPFECCISEYGVLTYENGGSERYYGRRQVAIAGEATWDWERCYSMSGSTIS